MQVPGGATLLQLCRESSLARHPFIAGPLANLDAEKVLEHLKWQRAWFSALTPIERERLDVRRSVGLIHAKTACTILSSYEQLIAA